MRLGVCWYPEQWPRSTWERDVALMAETGLDVVRIGEFAWSLMEPSRGSFDWGWLDEAIATIAAAGMTVVLGTPTATPPVWLMRERPDVMSVGPDGARRAYGSRRHTCPTSPAYREEAARIVTAMAERYGQHAAIEAWQIDNEPGNHDSTRCWCDACQTAFTAWLEARFGGDVDALNRAWGNEFWSQTATTFDDVRLPVPTMTRHNPALDLAHLRFASEQVVAGVAEQRAILGALAPPHETFTNLYVGDVDVSTQAIGRLHGLGAMDSYPHGVSGPQEVAFLLDLTRGTALQAGDGAAARGGRGWVTEQQPGPVNWTPQNPAVAPGQVRLWGWQAAMHGIETLLFFRWRAALRGQEQYHSGLLRHDGTADQGLVEAARLRRELDEAPPELLERPEATVALVYDHADAWAMNLDPHRPGLTHRKLVVDAHAGARRTGAVVDVVPVDADLTGYAIVLAPGLHLINEARVATLLAAADAGATVVVGARTLVKDTENGWTDAPHPHGLAERLGAHVTEWGSTATWPVGGEEPLLALDGELLDAGPWAETFAPNGSCEVLATWAGTHRDGQPAVVRGDGIVGMGASSEDAWAAVVGMLAGRDVVPAGEERHERGALTVTLRQADLGVTRT